WIVLLFVWLILVSEDEIASVPSSLKFAVWAPGLHFLLHILILDSTLGQSVIVFLSLLLGSDLDKMVSEYKSWGMLGFMLFFTLYILLGAQLAKFPRNLEWTLVWISSVYGMKYSNVETENILQYNDCRAHEKKIEKIRVKG
ncbi:hypothetical protein LINPERPRIM_LOCUS42610, partial [Linum perenne]